jgi:hypothetical protein
MKCKRGPGGGWREAYDYIRDKSPGTVKARAGNPVFDYGTEEVK